MLNPHLSFFGQGCIDAAVKACPMA